MSLEQALQQIAEQLGLSAEALIVYANSDDIGGWDQGVSGWTGGVATWPIGSIWSVEGQVLYALVRALDVQVAAELGTLAGCSASHIAQAMLDKSSGELVCVDPDRVAGYLLLYDRAQVVTFAHEHSTTWLESQPANSLDLLFTDTPKNAAVTEAEIEQAVRLLRPGGVMVIHDAVHFLAGAEIQAGIQVSGLEGWQTYRIDPSDCGLAIWQKPHAQRLDDDQDEETLQVQYADEPAYGDMTAAELRDLLDERGVEYPVRAKKQQLIDLLVETDGA